MHGTHAAGLKSPRTLQLLAFAILITGSLYVWARPGILIGGSSGRWAFPLRVGSIAVGSDSSSGSSSGDADVDLFAALGNLHGPVKKKGPLDPRQYLEPFAVQRFGLYQDYLAQHPYTSIKSSQPGGSSKAGSSVVGGKEGSLRLPEPQPVTFPMCQVWVNHTYKIIYLRHAKAGSTSVKHWFNACAKPDALHVGGCAELSRLDPSTSAKEAERMWKEYFVFASVRNPYNRAVSQYKMLRRTMRAKPECEDLVSWDSFCAFPPVMGLACRKKPECCVMKEGFAYIHLVGQAGCMTTEDGELAVDYVIRAGRLDEEREALYKEINRRRPHGTLPLPLPELAPRLNEAPTCEHGWRETELWDWQGKNHTTLAPKEQYCSTTEYYGPKHPHCAAQLTHFYGADVRLVLGGEPGSGSDAAGADVESDANRRRRGGSERKLQ